MVKVNAVAALGLLGIMTQAAAAGAAVKVMPFGASIVTVCSLLPLVPRTPFLLVCVHSLSLQIIFYFLLTPSCSMLTMSRNAGEPTFGRSYRMQVSRTSTSLARRTTAPAGFLSTKIMKATRALWSLTLQTQTSFLAGSTRQDLTSL